jgi:FHS family L-fucose permease-like MFS transporter
MESGQRPKAALLPLILITALFFLWGVANNLNDVLIPQFKKTFTLNDWQSGLVQSAFYMGYFVLALPAGMVMRRFGYKSAVVLGLALYGAGALLFYPAAQAREYSWFLAAGAGRPGQVRAEIELRPGLQSSRGHHRHLHRARVHPVRT